MGECEARRRHQVDVEVALREGGGSLGSQLADRMEAEAARIASATPCSGETLLLRDGGSVSHVFGGTADQIELLCSPACRQDASGGPSRRQIWCHVCVCGCGGCGRRWLALQDHQKDAMLWWKLGGEPR